MVIVIVRVVIVIGIVGSIVLAFHTQITTSKEKTCTRIKCGTKRNYNGFY